MKFDALFEMKAPEFFKEAELNKTFIRQIEEISEDHYDYVIESIISVNTNNAINHSGHSHGAGEPFIHEPLLGLYKTHCIGPSVQSMFMNMKPFKNGLKKSNNQENKFDIDFTEKEKENLIEQLKKEQDIASAIEKYSKNIVDKLFNKYKQRRANQQITGNWLIFGKSDNKNIFLYLSVGYDHSPENDLKIYQSLVDMYSGRFIQELKSKGNV